MPAIAADPVPPPHALVTAEEFVRDHAHRYAELVRGVLVEAGVPSSRHGQVCAKAARLIGNFVEDHRLGHTFTNDPHILIRRDPDTVRGPDLCFIGYDRLPPGPAPDGVSDLIPQLAVEVRSPSNTWSDIFGKVGEYLKHGVTVVLVLDPDGVTASLYRADTGQATFYAGQELTIPDVLPGFAVPVARFFE